MEIKLKLCITLEGEQGSVLTLLNGLHRFGSKNKACMWMCEPSINTHLASAAPFTVHAP